MTAARIVTEQESATRLTVRIERELWDGIAEIGRIEIDIARHLDPRVSIRVLRIEESCTGPVEVSMS